MILALQSVNEGSGGPGAAPEVHRATVTSTPAVECSAAFACAYLLAYHGIPFVDQDLAELCAQSNGHAELEDLAAALCQRGLDAHVVKLTPARLASATKPAIVVTGLPWNSTCKDYQVLWNVSGGWAQFLAYPPRAGLRAREFNRELSALSRVWDGKALVVGRPSPAESSSVSTVFRYGANLCGGVALGVFLVRTWRRRIGIRPS